MFYSTILVLLLLLKIRKCPENLANYIVIYIDGHEYTKEKSKKTTFRNKNVSLPCSLFPLLHRRLQN